MIARRRLAPLLLPLALPRAARAAPARIVVAGGGVSEIVVALGAGDRIIGCDSTSLFPAALRQRPQVGYLRNLSAEGVLSLRPDLLLLAHEAGPPPAVAQLRAAGLPVIQAPRILSAAELAEAVAIIGAALRLEAPAASLASAVQEDFAALAGILPRPARPPSAIFLLAAGAGAPMASGSGTAAAAMLDLAGARNVIGSYSGYRPVSPEAALVAAPDWLVASSHSVEARGGADAFLAQPQLALLPAAREKRLVVMDSLYLLGFGPRTAHAARDLAAALHRQPDMQALPARPWLRDML
jgi:iron complex transport system substrate-binding protein